MVKAGSCSVSRVAGGGWADPRLKEGWRRVRGEKKEEKEKRKKNEGRGVKQKRCNERPVG